MLERLDKLIDHINLRSKTWESPLLTPPGIVTGVAYADGDAVGAPGSFVLPYRSGLIQAAEYNDHSDQGFTVDLFLYRERPAAPVADNAPFVYTALSRDVEKQIGPRIQFLVEEDDSNVRKRTASGLAQPFYLAENCTMWYQMVFRGAGTIAASLLPSFRLTFLLDG